VTELFPDVARWRHCFLKLVHHAGTVVCIAVLIIIPVQHEPETVNLDSWECHLLGCCPTRLVRTNIPEECITSIIRVTRIGELGTTLEVASNRNTLWRNAILILLHSISLQHASVVCGC
jgi:hypothetical protein